MGPPDEWHTNGYYLKTISHYDANFNLIDTVEGTVGSESADPTSTPVRMYYDDANNPNLVTRIVDQRNVTTKFTYSSADKLAQTEKYTEGQPHHEITALGYNPDGTLSSITDPIYRVTSFTYYADKTLASVNPPDAMPPIEYQYDAAGGLTQVKQKNDSGGDIYTDIARDWLGRITQITYPEAEQGQTRLVISYDYDATDLYDTNASYGVNVIDTNGIKTQYLYNSAGLLWKLVKDKGVGKTNAVTTFAYDAFANLVTLTDAKNQATTFTYDDLDRLATIHNAQNGQKSFVYYPDNSLKIRYDEKGQYIQYRYDVNNRLDLALYQDGSWVQYAYEPNGLLSTARRSVASLPVTFAYDSINRLLETNGELAGDVDKITYGYWESGHRSLMNSTLLGQTNYWLTLWNAPWKMQNPQGLVTEYQYDPDNCNLWKIIKTANIYTTFDFDNLDRLKSYTTYTPTTNAYTYEYDPDGSGPQPDKNTIQRITYPAAEGKKYEYNYDSLYRLSNEYWKTTGGSPLYTRNYLYDHADNRTQVSGGTTTDTYTVNNLNQVTAIDTGNTSFQYDYNGSMTQKTTNGLTATLQYDYENRLVRINYPTQSGGGWTEFVYDALGRRLKTIEKNAQGAVTSEWHYVYDGLDMIALLNGSDTLVASITHGPGIDDPLIVRYNGVDYYYHKNHQGSVTEILNSSGGIVKTYRYDAYGKILQETGPTIPGGFTYTGRELHYRSGLYYYRARFYDPAIGRFTTQDPIGQIGGVNLYAYTGNNPVNRKDPLGLLLGEMGPTLGILWGETDQEILDPPGYADVNITAGAGLALTGGTMVSDDGIYPYLGASLATSPGVALTYGPMDEPTPGLNLGFQAGYIYGFQVGRGGGEWFWELGLVSPGIAVSWYEVFDPFSADSAGARCSKKR